MRIADKTYFLLFRHWGGAHGLSKTLTTPTSHSYNMCRFLETVAGFSSAAPRDLDFFYLLMFWNGLCSCISNQDFETETDDMHCRRMAYSEPGVMLFVDYLQHTTKTSLAWIMAKTKFFQRQNNHWVQQVIELYPYAPFLHESFIDKYQMLMLRDQEYVIVELT